jgi:hypothetical protein
MFFLFSILAKSFLAFKNLILFIYSFTYSLIHSNEYSLRTRYLPGTVLARKTAMSKAKTLGQALPSGDKLFLLSGHS